MGIQLEGWVNDAFEAEAQAKLAAGSWTKCWNAPVRSVQYDATGKITSDSEFTLEDPKNPKFVGSNLLMDTAALSAAGPVDFGPDYNAFVKENAMISPWALPDVETSPVSAESVSTDEDCLALRRRGLYPRSSACGNSWSSDIDSAMAADKDVKIVLTRVNSIFRTVVSLSDDAQVAGLAAGVAASLAAAVFIIIDFIEGQWQAATFAMSSILAGAVTDLMIGGPVGVLAGAIVGTLFAILPGIFEAKQPPPSNSVVQILQFAFFGDKDHTGNEACNAKRAQAGLSQNCTVAYGPAIISKIFGWKMADSIAFLVEYNQGQSMAIPDMAAAFVVVDHTSPNIVGGANDTATIDCGYSRSCTQQNAPVQGPGAAASMQPCTVSEGYACSKPVFGLKKGLITIPYINATAEDVDNRMIPNNPNGDCKPLVTPPGGQMLPFFNITVTGMPAGFGCNLTEQFPGVYNSQFNYGNGSFENGVFVNQTLNQSSGNTTSTGVPGQSFVEPPAPKPFTLLNSLNSVCISSTSSPSNVLCLPSGTWPTCSGADFGFTTSKANTVTFPGTISGSLKTDYDPQVQLPTTYMANLTDNSNFQKDMTLATSTGVNLTVDLGNPPALMVFFSKPGFGGDYFFLGPGGGNFTSDGAGKVQSIKVLGNIAGWVYPNGYGDLGGTYISTDVSDLASIPYGDNGNFRNLIKAAWLGVGVPMRKKRALGIRTEVGMDGKLELFQPAVARASNRRLRSSRLASVQEPKTWPF